MSQTSARLRIVFVVTALTLGGAEMMLWKLLSRIDRRRFDPHVIALSATADTMLDRFQAIDVPCALLGMRPRLDASWRVLRLAEVLRKLRPDIVQGWLYHGNVAATLAASAIRTQAPVLWNIRGTLPSPAEKNWRSSLIIRLSGLLSSTPARIINNSVASAHEHEVRLGYPAETAVVIANGFDTELFRPSAEAHAALRADHGLAADAVIVGLVGRYHAMKDHANFLRAAAIVTRSRPGIYYFLAGAQVDCHNRKLTPLITELGLQRNVRLLGRHHDMEKLTAGLDVACSSSAYGEGFPNVIGEAMSCAVPCVVTDVGDSARIVDDTGSVVPPRQPLALADALRKMIESPVQTRHALGARARQRIVKHFSLDAIVQQYEELYTGVYGENARRMVLAPSVRADQR